MTHEYKAGDKVRVVDAKMFGSGGHYVNGDIFEVKSVEDGIIFTTEEVTVDGYDGTVMLYTGEVEPYDEAEALKESLAQALAVQQFFGGHPRYDAEIPEESMARQSQSAHLDVRRIAEIVTYGTEGHPHAITKHHDSVNSPAHYANSKIETIDYMADKLPAYTDGFTGHCAGNVIKYVSRAPHKHETPLEDLRKAMKYLEFAIAHEEKKRE